MAQQTIGMYLFRVTAEPAPSDKDGGIQAKIISEALQRASIVYMKWLNERWPECVWTVEVTE